MSVRYEVWTGHYLKMLPTLRRAVGQYALSHYEFKIGVTVNPEQRWLNHKCSGWKQMIVLYETSSSYYAAAVEQDLIEHGWQAHLDKSWNDIRGGGGLRSGYATYFIYAILA